MNKLLHVILGLLFTLGSLLGQTNDQPLKITGDSLKGKTVNGESVREVIGNVVITQEDVRITCNKAVQFLQSNAAELIGNVIITQDSVVIKTEYGKYFGNEKIAQSDSAVHLNNGEMDLTADKGNYNLDSKIAQFFGNVIFKDSSKTLNSDSLKYFKNIEQLIAVGNVEVADSASVIKADSLIHLRDTKYSEGFGNIVIENTGNDLNIYGDYLVDDKAANTSKVTGNPFLRQIEKLSDGTFDTLMIKSKVLESREDSTANLYAIDSVRILRGNFLSNNDFTIYDRESEEIKIFKQEKGNAPILWYENSQVVGDSIYIHIDSSRISEVNIIKDAIIISEDSLYNFRYNQMSGDSIKLSFYKGKLNKTKVNGNVLSIYYLYEEKEPNGLLKSSANEIVIMFENSKVNEVKMFGSPISEYHPENLVKNNEKDFTLPTFIIYSNKPKKEEFKSIFLKQGIN